MALPLSVLLVEDEPEDCESIKQELERAGFQPDITTAEIERDFFSQLEQDVQIIISEHSLRQFDALRGLQILKERGIDTPMVVVGDKVGEELAVESIKQGAADFVLRTRLNRLGQVVKRVLQEQKVAKERNQVESGLREDLRRYQQVFESCPVGIALVEEEQIAFVNRAGARLLGAASPKQIVGKGLPEFAHTESKTAIEAAMKTTAEGEAGAIRQQETFVRLDGQALDLSLELAPVNQNGSRGTLVVLSETPQDDDSDLDLALFQSQLFTCIADALVAVDHEKKVTTWNRPAEQLYGLLAEEALGRNITDVYQPRWAKPEDEEACRQALQKEGFWRGERIHVKANGEEMLVNSTLSRLQDEEGQPKGWIEVIRDITEQKQLSTTLEKERNFYSSVLSSADALLVVYDPTGRIILFNQACEQLSGHTLGEVRQKPAWEVLVPSEETEETQRLLQEPQVDQFPRQRESRWSTKAKEDRIILWAENLLTDEKGVPSCIVSAGVDITDRRREEEETQSKNQYFQSLFENLPELVVVLEKGGAIRSATPVFLEALGTSAEELTGKHLQELVGGKAGEDLRRALTELEQTPGATVPIELTLQREETPLVARGVIKNSLEDSSVAGLVATLSDVSGERKEQEEIDFQMRSMDTIHAIDLATVNSLDPQVTAKIVLEQVVSQLDADAVSVLTYDPESQSLSWLAGRGFGSSAVSRTPVRPGEGAAGRSALERQTVLVSNLDASSPREGLLSEAGFRTCWATPLVARGALKGVLEVFHRSPFSPDDVRSNFLSAVASQTALALDNTDLISRLRQQNDELGMAGALALEELAKALDAREQIQAGHSLRLAEAATKLGTAMGLAKARLADVRRGALLHDVGKIFVPESILHKPGPLTDPEWEILRQHPVHAQQLLSSLPGLRDSAVIPSHHHEKWDGSGYPGGLKDEAIPLEARVFSVVEAWEVLALDRPYRKAWTASKIRNHVESQAGIDFDPQVVKTFLDSKQQGAI